MCVCVRLNAYGCLCVCMKARQRVHKQVTERERDSKRIKKGSWYAKECGGQVGVGHVDTKVSERKIAIHAKCHKRPSHAHAPRVI